MRRERIPINKIGSGKKRVGSGYVEVKKIQGPSEIEKINPLETAHHEAAHVVMAFLVGIGVIEATDKPGSGYGGYTLTTGGPAYKSALVFAAAEAQGSKGTGKGNEAPGSDMYWIRALGFEPSEVVAHARSILSPKKIQDKIFAVATRIRNKRIINGTEAHKATKETEDESMVAVTTYDESGTFERVRLVRTDHYTTEVEFIVPKENPGIQELPLAA